MSANSKFGRNYELAIQNAGPLPLLVTLPFTIEIDITRHSLSSANTCNIKIYNLSALNRNNLLFNAYNYGTFRLVQLKAGYGSSLTNIFTGNIFEAWSVREKVNFITNINCYDGGFAFVNGDININFLAGTPRQTVIETIMNLVPNVTFGAAGLFSGVLMKDESYSGNPAQILYEMTGGAFFIDKGKSYVLKLQTLWRGLGLLPLSMQIQAY